MYVFHPYPTRASKAKVLRLEKETREMEKTVEALRHAQAKGAELEKTNKKLHAQTHNDRKEIIKLKEENEVLKVKASRVDKLQVELSTQRERVEEANRIAPKLKVSLCCGQPLNLYVHILIGIFKPPPLPHSTQLYHVV